MSKPLVSIIVPVYNVLPYLEECLESLVRQTYQNLEIIVVDDGSTDGSGALCDALATDGRIQVFHKQNGGLSDARNYGLAHSHGEWISFVDSDDYISPVFIEALLRAALDTGCDIAAIPTGKQFKDGEACELIGSLPAIPVTTLASSRTQRLMLYQVWDTGAQWRIYKKGTLGEDPFPKGLYYEDLASVYKIIHKVGKVAFFDCRDLYAYRVRSTSIIRQQYRPIKAESALRIAEQLYHDICEWYPDLAAAAASRCFSVCRMVFAQVPTSDSASEAESRDRYALWKVIERHRKSVLLDPHARKRERLAAAISYFGINAFSFFCMFARKAGLLQ
ncbi:glycosyltransferase family 2 protein [Enorma massiliensis]|uniref:glycosyltransferase family 2 protein n=1 Tax=Enorma massiliensis TaxID=1472761 RepID=UPI003AEF764D